MVFPRFAVVLLSCGLSLCAADPAAGTWKLDPGKSKFSPGPPPQSATVTYEETSDGIRRSGETVDASGNKTTFEYVAKYDGKDYSVKGSDTFDTISLKKVNDRTVQATLKKGGKVVGSARRVLSNDGKVLTITVTGTNAQGQKMKNVMVYEKT